jgi:hypothetical protein
VNMRLEDMRYAKTRFARHIDIKIDIRSRIENRSDAFVIVTEEVRKFRDAFSLNGFKNERHDHTLRQSAGELQQDRESPCELWGAQAGNLRYPETKLTALLRWWTEDD